MNAKSIIKYVLVGCIVERACLVNSFRPQHLPTATTTTRDYHALGRRYVGYIHEPPHEDATGAAQHAPPKLTPFESAWTKCGMIAYILHMCVFLPASLVPTYLRTQLGLISKKESEHESLMVGQRCAKTLLKWIPFMNIEVSPCIIEDQKPSIVVSNHVSMLDTFVFLASDEELRGKNRRPIKTLYWKGLDNNPICKILFSMAGFISVDMTPNGPGVPNEYNRKSFKQMLKDTRRAIDDGFDVFILPEGQLNPNPERGLNPILPGAYALAKSSNRPIQMVALYGCHHLWHAEMNDANLFDGMDVVGRDVKIKAYPPVEREFQSADEFSEAFSAVVGTYGATGKDCEDLDRWLS